MASAILGWSKHASRMVRFNGMLQRGAPKLFRDIYEGGVVQRRGYMTLDSRVIGGCYSSNVNASRARDYSSSSDGLDVSTNGNRMIYMARHTLQRKRNALLASKRARTTMHFSPNTIKCMYRSCTHCPNCLAHNQFPSYCDCPSATAFHTQHNQICRHSCCTHCLNCFAHVSHHQLPSYCCKLPLAPPRRRRVGGRTVLVRQSYEGTAFATVFAERFENWCNKYSKTEEEKPVLSIARLRGKGILAEESGRVEQEWNEEIEW